MMLISEKNNSINFNVIGYEFPNEIPSKRDFNYDANWLNLEFVCCKEKTSKTYTDTCLLTYELSDLVTAFEQIINGSENSYISDFMEPYLSVCITKVDEFIIFVLSFVYEMSKDNKWSKIGITAKWTMPEAKDKVKELREMERKFPKR